MTAPTLRFLVQGSSAARRAMTNALEIAQQMLLCLATGDLEKIERLKSSSAMLLGTSITSPGATLEWMSRNVVDGLAGCFTPPVARYARRSPRYRRSELLAWLRCGRK